MTPLAQALSTALFHFIWQGIAVGVLLWIALFLLRRSSADSRYAVSCLALAVLAAVPVITAWSLYTPLPDAKVVSEAASNLAVGEIDALASVPLRLTSWYVLIQAWALPAWSLGVLLFALRLAWSCGHAAALRREGTPTETWILSIVDAAAKRVGVQRHIRVLMSSIAEVPSVVGWIRPVILLPAATIAGLTPQQLEAVIAHELAHIRRHDYLVNLLQTVVETLLFYHPVVWWTSASIRRERELCCDDLAVRSCGDAVCYARALTKLEKLRVWKPGLAMNSAHGPLFDRIQRVLTGDGGHGPSRFACAVGLLAGVLCLAFSLGWAQDRQDEDRVDPNKAIQELLPFVPPVPPTPPVPPAAPLSPAIAPVAPPAPPAAPLSPAIPPAAPPLPPAAPLSPAIAPVAPPAPPAAPLSPVIPPVAPPAPVLTPPVPPTPPIPPSQELRLEFTAQGIELAGIQTEETPWVLFRGTRVMASGSSEDQAQARAARAAAGGGDLLWFRQNGKAYSIQDAETLARLDALLSVSLGDQQRAAEVQQLALQLRNREAQEASMRASVSNLQVDIAKLQASAQQLRPDQLQTDLSQLQAEIADMQKKILRTQIDSQGLAQQQADLVKQFALLQRQRAELARSNTRSELFNLLRDAVSGGKAKPLQ
jgi:beta-lactamase regulating signal transducer with metallopeptidase domain